MKTVIVANGRFPTHLIPLSLLQNATSIICCDGSVQHLDNLGYEPIAVVGDLDSVSEIHKERYSDRLFFDPNQDTNDLTKAVLWCKKHNINEVSILAGTGMRDDHTLGNIGLLPSYLRMGVKVKMVTDYGTLVPLISRARLKSFRGQKVSIFSFNDSTKISTINLKFPIINKALTEPWMGTLNESVEDWFEIDFTDGSMVVFQSH